MSKEFTKEDVIQNKKEAIKDLNKLLEHFINDPTGNHLKKANLMSYWIKDYAKMVNREESFEPTKLTAYKRGDIIKLNFGFNIGSEHGGLHYAIVINKSNARNSPVLTVIPLTSQKEGAPVHPNDLFLGNEIYRNLKLKYDTLSQNLQHEREEILKTQYLIISLLKLAEEKLGLLENGQNTKDSDLVDAKKYLNNAKKLKDDWEKKEKENAEASAQLKKIGAEITRMKSGSIALVDQITTVSKMRIYDPRNAKGVLSGIRLSPESLDKVNKKLADLFIF